MSETTSNLLKPGHSTATSTEGVVRELLAQIGEAPVALTLHFSPDQDGLGIARKLKAAWPSTQILGCSTAGEISTGKITQGGVSAGALGKGLVGRVATALAHLEGGIAEGVRAAVAALEAQLGQSLASLDPKRHVGLIFSDSTHGAEDATLVELGNAAPLLSFVGGSAGDNLAFKKTQVLANEAVETFGCSLAVMEVLRPFELVKICHFTPTGVKYTVTRTDGRRLLELDGRPAPDVYAEYVKVSREELTLELLAGHPAGIVIHGEPWVRQVVPPVVQDGAMNLGGELVAGQALHFFERSDELVHHFQERMKKVSEGLGGIKGALMFDCGLRRLELEGTGALDAYAKAIDFPAAGFHTHGEALIGHIHQTLTALAFG